VTSGFSLSLISGPVKTAVCGFRLAGKRNISEKLFTGFPGDPSLGRRYRPARFYQLFGYGAIAFLTCTGITIRILNITVCSAELNPVHLPEIKARKTVLLFGVIC